MTQLAIEKGHFEVGLAPVADAFSGTVSSDVVNLKNHGRVRFIVFWGVGATGTTLVTVEACDDVTPSNTSAVPFYYRRQTNAGTPGAITAATASGFTTTAGSTQIYEIEIAAEALLEAGYGYARLKCVEQVDSPILGGILIQMLDPKFSNSPTTATT